jgi:metal-responsive CopG/Arc/MetJ family transcriptional regulator
MKMAVSLPDKLFSGAEKLAKRMKVSRSDLYARTLGEYLSRHRPDDVTEALDGVCAQLGTPDESKFVAAASARVLEQMEW